MIRKHQVVDTICTAALIAALTAPVWFSVDRLSGDTVPLPEGCTQHGYVIDCRTPVCTLEDGYAFADTAPAPGAMARRVTE